MIDYDSFSRCHLTDIFFAFHFFRFSRGSKRVKINIGTAEIKIHAANSTFLLPCEAVFSRAHRSWIYSTDNNLKYVSIVSQII